ncbi:hypothetical protein B0G77_6279 [Paraburkholderia sp. BL10I2N1]|nr:hypothetical protein B0G77_6279 [Paraburkholderia sp. BL10I2N1]
MFHIRNISLCMVIIEVGPRRQNRNLPFPGKTPSARLEIGRRVVRRIPLLVAETPTAKGFALITEKP